MSLYDCFCKMTDRKTTTTTITQYLLFLALTIAKSNADNKTPTTVIIVKNNTYQ